MRLAAPPSGFLDAAADLSGRVFLFAYGGCDNVPDGVKVITANDIKKWFEENDNGKQYRNLIDHT